MMLAFHIWPLWSWGTFLLPSLLFLSWKNVKIYHMLFLHLLEWSYDFYPSLMWYITFVCLFIYITVIWTQGLPFEQLHQPFLCEGIFRDRVSWTIFLGWLQTSVFLISVFWVARITGVSHGAQQVYHIY
jgi:hypothetical protein